MEISKKVWAFVAITVTVLLIVLLCYLNSVSEVKTITDGVLI